MNKFISNFSEFIRFATDFRCKTIPVDVEYFESLVGEKVQLSGNLLSIRASKVSVVRS